MDSVRPGCEQWEDAIGMGKQQPAIETAVIYWGPSNLHAEAYASRLDAPLFNIHYLGWKRGPLVALIKYVPQFLQTWAVLLRHRPSVVYVIISPVFAALSVYLYCLFSGAAYVMDVHNHALYGDKWRWSIPLVGFLARRALVSVVDQPRNAQLFDSWGAKVLILERPPKAISSDRLKYIDDPNRFSVTVINTFAPDEPLDPIFGAARKYPDVPFYILGDTSQAENGLLNIAPPNIVFTGYLHGEDYWNRLYSSRAVIALTTAEYSLLSGAIEAMALGKPPILSRRQALKEYFTKGTVFVDHTAESIVVGISELQQNEDRLIEEISELNTEKQLRWEAVVEELMTLIKGETCKEASMLGG